MGDDLKIMPIQKSHRLEREHDGVRESVYMAAYEVYSVVYGPQTRIIEGDCRGGFGVGELVAFLYARAFPQSEWRQRCDEAFMGMQL